jgi:hypothetical protein
MKTLSEKPTVRYKELIAFYGAGHSCILFPIDHYNSELVSNTKPIVTSAVVNYDPATGRLETRNTVYVRA